MADEAVLLAAAMAPTLRAMEAISELAAKAFVDAKSGLLNAAALEVYRAEYDRDPTAKIGVVFVDLAGFKEVNDRHGHDAGDTAIGIAGAQLRELARGHAGQAYRHGGDEFIVIVPAARLPALLKAADQRMRILVFTWEDVKVEFGATIGYSQATEGNEALETLIKRADDACRRAKGHDGKPREWKGDDNLEVPISIRKKCDTCRTTTTVIVYPSRRQAGCLTSCPNCAHAFPT